MSAVYTDVLMVQAECGAHVAEIRRMASGDGMVEGNNITLFHKSGHRHTMEVAPEVAAAAKRLLNRGAFARKDYNDAVKRACVKAKVTQWHPGWLRHAQTKWLTEAGVALANVATYLGHSEYVSRKHYLSAAIPKPEIPGGKKKSRRK